MTHMDIISKKLQQTESGRRALAVCEAWRACESLSEMEREREE